MFSFLDKLLSGQKRELARLQDLVEQINNQEPGLEKLTDKQIEKKSQELKKRLAKEKIESLLPEAFALVREAAGRTIGQRHFDVQMMAAIALFEGKIIEQKTGEGKTLAATPALFLRALEGKGAHLVTVNDYLARRDTGWMGQIFHFLGLSTGCIVHDQAFIYDPDFSQRADDERLRHLRPVERKEAYQADITYGTNNEFGFDYLRDNMVHDLVDKVQRSHYFAIVDEVDFALIDEARTPLIISSPEAEPTEKYYQFAQLIRSLSPQTDYLVDEESRSVSLTDHGITKVEKSLGVENLYEKDFETIHHIENALKAKELFRLDRDYVIKDGEVVIVDEFTGRLMFGRRWSGGLHQAVEAKEGVEIKQESKTLATISFQNYFRLYRHLSGMTGTALTSAEEFRQIYHLETLAIPTNKPVIRKDYEDAIFKNQRAKYTAIASEVTQYYQKGQPVLIGTTSIEKNEIVSRLLKHKKIPHQVLNAKNHEKEASVLAQAGAKGAVTVATNMAGRGVDIVLGGEEPKITQNSKLKTQSYKKNHEIWQKKHDEVVALGGLHVIGTERHEARRIDDQLRGRAGRQGDPGSSRFFLALDDDMMRVFGGQQIAALMTRFNFPDDMPIENRLISRSIEQIQSKVEGAHFDARKRLVEYDDVANKQREIIYRVRDRILTLTEQEDLAGLENNLLSRVNQEIDNLVEAHFISLSPESDQEKISPQALVREFAEILPLDIDSQDNLAKTLKSQTKEKVKKHLKDLVSSFYQELVKKMGERRMIEIDKLVLLTTIDRLWIDHLDQMEDLREGVALRSYGQQDPLSVYRNEAFEQFEQLMNQIDYQVARKIFRVQYALPTRSSIFQRTQTNIDNQDGMGLVGGQDVFGQAKKNKQIKTVVHKTEPPGRNDPCPCGSGKKYKKCCYPKYG